MNDCFGITALGLCAYDPTNPPNIYFSVGEVVAALSITLILPQFLRPIYRFRLATQYLGVAHVYFIVFIAAVCVLTAAILPNLGFRPGIVLAFPIFWELLGGVLFFAAFGVLATAVMRPAKVRSKGYKRFGRAAADFLAHADTKDRLDFSIDLLGNIEKLVATSNSISVPRERDAFFEFRYRRQIEDASYASALLQLAAEPQFCEALVHRRPWDAAAMIHRISRSRLNAPAVKQLIQEIARQAIISETSMMAREIGYKGFSAAPVLSEALFEDRFINNHFQPLAGVEFQDLSDLSAGSVDRLCHALRSTMAVALSAGDYWRDRSLASMADHFRQAARDAHRQIRADESRYEVVSAVFHGLNRLIDDMSDHLDGLDRETYELLYVEENEGRRDFSLLDYLSEAIVEVLYSFANDFDGHEDPYWLSAMRIVDGVFDRHQNQQEGVSPLQQRVAIKIMHRVSKNMHGYYPALTRVLLPIIGPYKESVMGGSMSPFSLLAKAFYSELMHFPALYESDPEKASDFLPKNVRYDHENAAIVNIYRGGDETSTELRALSIEPPSFTEKSVRRKFVDLTGGAE